MERKVFRGVGVVITNVISHRKFEVVAKVTSSQVISFDRDRRFEIDLDRSPSTATAWSDVRVDDRGIDRERRPLAGGPCTGLLTGYHITNIGGHVGADRPDDLLQGCFVGGAYLEDGYFAQIRHKIDLDGNPWPCDGRRPYQLTTISYSNSPVNGTRRGLRYAGFEARVKRRLGPGQLQVELLGVHDGAPLGDLDLDLTSPRSCEAEPPLAAGEVALTADSKEGARGAVFVELGQLAQRPFENPKLPLALGS